MRALRIPCFVLLLLLVVSLANSTAVTRCCGRWIHMLDKAVQMTDQAMWTQADEQLSELERDISACSVWLHIISTHTTVDNAEQLISQARLMCRLQESTHLHETLCQLRILLRHLAEGEVLSLGNIL